MMRIGVFGGSFNPPHVGHLVIAEQARVQARLDRVLFIPAYVSPHKVGAELADSTDRLAMTELAVSDNPGFEAVDMEIGRGGVSYTVDTLRELKAQHPDWDLHLIIGGDSLRHFDTWREPQEIRRLARLVVYPRAEDDLDVVDPRIGNDLIVIDAPLLAISGTDIRRRIQTGGSVRYLVSEGVRSFIDGHALYR